MITSRSLWACQQPEELHPQRRSRDTMYVTACMRFGFCSEEVVGGVMMGSGENWCNSTETASVFAVFLFCSLAAKTVNVFTIDQFELVSRKSVISRGLLRMGF